ncbi:hypothetical protein T484DRAFT_1818612 [Baffinella frigidus]|nr:hypothetical protein T484DRAFT_1818612 [Cryptophyta sp. CCMP2293]
MPKMDSGLLGKCDPFLTLQCGEDKKQTKVIKRTLAPTWNETFTLKLASASA